MDDGFSITPVINNIRIGLQAGILSGIIFGSILSLISYLIFKSIFVSTISFIIWFTYDIIQSIRLGIKGKKAVEERKLV